MSDTFQVHIDSETAKKLRKLAEANHLTYSGAVASIVYQFFSDNEVLTKKAPRAKMISRPTWRFPDPEEAKTEVDRMNRELEEAKRGKNTGKSRK